MFQGTPFFALGFQNHIAGTSGNPRYRIDSVPNAPV